MLDTSWSLPLGSLFGVKVRIHFTFFFLLAWYGWDEWQYTGWEGARFRILFIILLFTCILAHEFGHILTARYFGIRSPSVTLWPFGGVALLERTPEKPKEEFLITLAGPMVNVAIFGILYATFYTGNIPRIQYIYINYGKYIYELIENIMLVNLYVAIFNFIPAFPMDGGRILRSVLSFFFGFITATKIATYLGQAIACLFVFWGIYDETYMLSIIGIFIFSAARTELQYIRQREW